MSGDIEAAYREAFFAMPCSRCGKLMSAHEDVSGNPPAYDVMLVVCPDGLTQCSNVPFSEYRALEWRSRGRKIPETLRECLRQLAVLQENPKRVFDDRYLCSWSMAYKSSDQHLVVHGWPHGTKGWLVNLRTNIRSVIVIRSTPLEAAQEVLRVVRLFLDGDASWDKSLNVGAGRARHP